jgi:hypothetical protein
MTLTLPEINERLKQLDEVTLLEILGVTSEDLVDRFSDVIECKAEILLKQIDWE